MLDLGEVCLLNADLERPVVEEGFHLSVAHVCGRVAGVFLIFSSTFDATLILSAAKSTQGFGVVLTETLVFDLSHSIFSYKTVRSADILTLLRGQSAAS